MKTPARELSRSDFLKLGSAGVADATLLAAADQATKVAEINDEAGE